MNYFKEAIICAITPDRNAVVLDFIDTEGKIEIVVRIECKDAAMLPKLKDYAKYLLHGAGK